MRLEGDTVYSRDEAVANPASSALLLTKPIVEMQTVFKDLVNIKHVLQCYTNICAIELAAWT